MNETRKHDDHDLSALSPAARSIFERIDSAGGLHGSDGEDGAASAEGAEGAPEGDATAAPTEGDAATAEGTEGDATAEGDASPTVPEDLTAVEVEALRSLYGELGDHLATIREGARTRADVDQINTVVAQRRAIFDEIGQRAEEDRQVQEELRTLDESLREETPLPEPAVPVASVTPPVPTAAAIAAARGTQAPAAQQASAPARPRVRVPLLAAVSGGRVSAGAEMTVADLGDALDRNKRGETRTIVASFQPFEELGTGGGAIPELVGRGSAERNSELMREARNEHSAMRRGEPMQGAICTPLDIMRDIPDEFNTSEPVTGIFPARPAGRLGFQFFPSVDLSAVTAGVAQWGETEQAAVDVDDPDTWKVCLDVGCPTAQTTKATAVVGCLTWDLTTEMSNPENIANLTSALTAMRARAKEGKVLSLIDATSHHYRFEGNYGAVPTVIEVLNTVIAQATFASRLEESMYSAILPPGVVAMLAIDLANRGYNPDTVTDVLTYVRDRVPGIRDVIMSLDVSIGSGVNAEPSPFYGLNPIGSLDDLPSLDAKSGGYHPIRVIDPDDYLYYETGALNVGTTRDSQLIRANKVQYFAEEFLGLAKQGPSPAFRVDTRLCHDGARAGLVEPAGCVS